MGNLGNAVRNSQSSYRLYQLKHPQITTIIKLVKNAKEYAFTKRRDMACE